MKSFILEDNVIRALKESATAPNVTLITLFYQYALLVNKALLSLLFKKARPFADNPLAIPGTLSLEPVKIANLLYF